MSRPNSAAVSQIASTLVSRSQVGTAGAWYPRCAQPGREPLDHPGGGSRKVPRPRPSVADRSRGCGARYAFGSRPRRVAAMLLTGSSFPAAPRAGRSSPSRLRAGPRPVSGTRGVVAGTPRRPAPVRPRCARPGRSARTISSPSSSNRQICVACRTIGFAALPAVHTIRPGLFEFLAGRTGPRDRGARETSPVKSGGRVRHAPPGRRTRPLAGPARYLGQDPAAGLYQVEVRVRRAQLRVRPQQATSPQRRRLTEALDAGETAPDERCTVSSRWRSRTRLETLRPGRRLVKQAVRGSPPLPRRASC